VCHLQRCSRRTATSHMTCHNACWPAQARDGSKHGDDASRPARTVTRGDVDVTTRDQSRATARGRPAPACSRHEEFSAASDPSNRPRTAPTYCSGREGRRGG
jgi:hypothetical protein